MSKKKIGIIVAVIFVALIGVVGGTQTPDTQTDIKKTTTSIYTELRVDDRVVVPLESEGKESDADTVSVQGYTSEITTEEIEKTTEKAQHNKGNYNVALGNVPAFSGKAYVVINDNVPGLSAEDRESAYFEKYTPLDSFGRCGVAVACLGKETMPDEERGAIGSVKPSGWHTVKYDIVDGRYLYNRCHLIGFQLSGENANVRNLITGTRYMNMEGMLPFENMVADYIKETNNHVLYRVTPVFDGLDLVAKGVQIEAFSVEDDGDGICFNVFCYNAQPGVEIDYSTGESWLNAEVGTTSQQITQKSTEPETERVEEEIIQKPVQFPETEEMVWIPSSGSKYHSYASCSNMKNPSQVSKSEAEDMGYEPCKRCH